MKAASIAVVSLGIASLVIAQQPDKPQIDVVGQVGRDRIPWRKNLTLLDIVLTSRPLPDADLRAVVVLRVDELAVSLLEVDVRKMLLNGDTTLNIAIAGGDIVVVPVKDPDNPRVRIDRRVFDELAAVDPSTFEGRRMVAMLAWRLETDHDDKRRQRIAAELGVLGADAAPAVPHLVRALRGKPVVAREAATSLGLIGAAAKAAVPALERFADHDDKALRARAAAAVRQIRKALESR